MLSDKHKAPFVGFRMNGFLLLEKGGLFKRLLQRTEVSACCRNVLLSFSGLDYVVEGEGSCIISTLVLT